jgi:Zn ribbon nucleic-acid-binding protein
MNNNVLAGISCPKCSSVDSFKIYASATFTVHDYGTDHFETVEWDETAPIECLGCHHHGKVAEFRVKIPNSMELLLELVEAFSPADPASEFFGEENNGCEAVDFLSSFVPIVRARLDADENVETALEVLKACWSFIEDVADDDPARNEKFFELRGRVRGVLWE